MDTHSGVIVWAGWLAECIECSPLPYARTLPLALTDMFEKERLMQNGYTYIGYWVGWLVG